MGTMQLLSAVLTAAACGGGAWAQSAAVPIPAVAVQICAVCHQISAGGNDPGAGPSFVAVARMSSTTALSLHVFLQSSHANMPNWQLDAADMDAVTGYILSLRGP